MIAVFVTAPAGAQNRPQVYRVQHRTAEELLPLATAAMHGDGSAVVDRGSNSIVLIGSSQAVSDAIALLAQQDRRARTVVIQHESRSRADLDESGIEIEWSAGAGQWSIGNVRFPGGESGAAIDVHAGDRVRTRALASTIRVTEGQRTRITMGEARPVVVGGPGWRREDIVTTESGVEAGARILGDGRVEIDLASIDERFSHGAVRGNTADTLLTIEPGRTIAVGSIERSHGDTRTEALSGASRDRGRESLILLLRVEIE